MLKKNSLLLHDTIVETKKAVLRSAHETLVPHQVKANPRLALMLHFRWTKQETNRGLHCMSEHTSCTASHLKQTTSSDGADNVASSEGGMRMKSFQIRLMKTPNFGWEGFYKRV